MKREEKIAIVAKVLIGGIGIALIAVYGSWQVALGVFLMWWGNNIGTRL